MRYNCHMTTSTISDWFILNPTDASPIHSQIEMHVKLAIARGRLEAGGRLPTIRSMARTLGVHPNTVARAYASLVREGVLMARPGRGTFVGPGTEGSTLISERDDHLNAIMSTALVEALSLGYPPEQVEASFALRLARLRQEARRWGVPAEPRRKAGSEFILTGSHDIAIELLAQHLKRLADFEIASSYTGSLGGLVALAQGEAHVAGCHLLDEESGEYNLPFVKRVMVGVPAVIITLVERTQGLIVPRGNPGKIQGMADVIQSGLKLINRQKGSGTRVLLDFLLRNQGFDHQLLKGYETEVDTHLEVAEAVASGGADAGLGILAAARAFDLDFVPVRKERFDLVMARSTQDWPRVRALRSVLENEEFKAAVHELGGYDTTRTGKFLAEVDA